MLPGTSGSSYGSPRSFFGGWLYRPMTCTNLFSPFPVFLSPDRLLSPHKGVRIPLNEQLQNHRTVVSKISSRPGNGSSSYLKRCLYMINIETSRWFFTSRDRTRILLCYILKSPRFCWMLNLRRKGEVKKIKWYC